MKCSFLPNECANLLSVFVQHPSGKFEPARCYNCDTIAGPVLNTHHGGSGHSDNSGLFRGAETNLQDTTATKQLHSHPRMGCGRALLTEPGIVHTISKETPPQKHEQNSRFDYHD
jgi:hypothetical protein